MATLNSGEPDVLAKRSDLHAILGEIDDATALAILDMQPTVRDVEQAFVWLSSERESVRPDQRSPEGVVARICDLLAADVDDGRTDGPQAA